MGLVLEYTVLIHKLSLMYLVFSCKLGLQRI